MSRTFRRRPLLSLLNGGPPPYGDDRQEAIDIHGNAQHLRGHRECTKFCGVIGGTQLSHTLSAHFEVREACLLELEILLCDGRRLESFLQDLFSFHIPAATVSPRDPRQRYVNEETSLARGNENLTSVCQRLSSEQQAH